MNPEKCSKCGQDLPRPLGRPQKLDDKEVARLSAKGDSHRKIAAKFGVTHGAIRASLLRTEKRNEKP